MPSQVAVPFEGAGHAKHDALPQVAALAFKTHWPVHRCAPALHEVSTQLPVRPSQAPWPCAKEEGQSAQASPQPRSTPNVLKAETVAGGLEHPWGLEFLPDGRMIVTERPGRLRIVTKDGKISAPLSGVPRVVAQGQGGLLDVALDPNFASNRYVYLSFAVEGGTNGTALDDRAWPHGRR